MMVFITFYPINRATQLVRYILGKLKNGFSTTIHTLWNFKTGRITLLLCS